MMLYSLFAITLALTANAQLPGIESTGRRVSGRTRNKFPQTLPSTRISPEPFSVRASAVAGNSRVIIGPAKHPNTEIRNFKTEEASLDSEWRVFKAQYNKTYPTPEEDIFRKEVFITNRRYITRFNQDYSFGLSRFVLKVNPMADLLSHEFNDRLNGFRLANRDGESSLQESAFIKPLNVKKPSSFDWKEKGGVSAARTQGICASCHAFTAAGAVEGHHFRKTGVLNILSPQNLVDCTKGEYDGYGCAQGGYVDEDFRYIKENPGIDLESGYPYEARDGECRFDSNYIGANVTGYVKIPEGDEEALETVIATLGPVAAGIDAGQESFQFYSEGIYYDENCKNNPDNINHAVLVIGYGVEPDGSKFWLAKNSYGPEWGLGGYVKMAKDSNNHCGITTAASYPLV